MRSWQTGGKAVKVEDRYQLAARYQCRFHDNMRGQVLAAAIAIPPTLPKAGSAFSRPPSTPVSGGSGIGTAMLVLLGLFALMASRALSLLMRRRAN